MPPDQKQYNIESSSGGMGEKVLRDILAKETESPRKAERKEISPENYDFQLLGSEMLEGRNCYVISLNPRREEKDLIRGKMWVDATSYNIHRIEGNPTKSPSWWIRDLHILMNFTNVDGMWLHTFTHAVADVRFNAVPDAIGVAGVNYVSAIRFAVTYDNNIIDRYSLLITQRDFLKHLEQIVSCLKPSPMV